VNAAQARFLFLVHAKKAGMVPLTRGGSHLIMFMISNVFGVGGIRDLSEECYGSVQKFYCYQHGFCLICVDCKKVFHSD